MKKLRRKRLFKLMGLVSACMLLLVGYKEEYRIIKSVDVGEMLSLAHRGASGHAPENTYAAFQKGLELGADYLELDVHLSKEGKLVIIHDDKVDRTTNGKGFVSDYTIDELKGLDAGGLFHESFTGEQLITLDEMLQTFYGKIGLLIEIKKPTKNWGIEEKLAILLGEYEDLSSIVVQSFNLDSMRKMHQLLPELQIAVLMKSSAISPSSKSIQDLMTFATYINFNISYVNERAIHNVHKYGGKVFVWGAVNERLVKRAFQYGVDGIISDFSEWPKEESLFLANET